MHHEQKHQLNQLQQQQQGQEAQIKSQAEGAAPKRKSKKVTVLDPANPEMYLRRVGACEAVEKYLLNIIRSRQDGIWVSPDMEEVSPEHPNVFVARWIDYERYGYGWQLSNGVVGVLYNDRTSLALSPNGEDIEVTESPQKRKRRYGSHPSTFLRRRTYFQQQSGAVQESRKNHWYGNNGRRHQHHQHHQISDMNSEQSNNSNSNPRSIAESMAELRAGLVYEKELDRNGEYQFMMIYDDKNNLVTPSASRSVSLVPGGGEGSMSLASSNNMSSTVVSKVAGEKEDHNGVGSGGSDGVDVGSSILTEILQEQDFYDEWDHEEFLETLDRTYCRFHARIPRLEKRIKVLEGFNSYMVDNLNELPPWCYEDKSLSKGMPFLTDLYRTKEKKHVIVRLSNGIVQINFEDHTKLIFSHNGEVVTLIDGDEIPRRITLKTYQALAPNYFYDLQDEEDQMKLVEEELLQIELNQQQQQQQQQEQKYDNTHAPDAIKFEEYRPVFHPDKDHDLVIFPRPQLRAKAAKYQQQQQQQQAVLQHKKDYHHHQKQDNNDDDVIEVDEHGNRLSSPSSSFIPLEYPPIVESAPDTMMVHQQVEIHDINKDDEPLMILQTTMKGLHLEMVRRIHLSLRLLMDRRMETAQDRMRGRLENEHYLKDREESRRRQVDKKEKEKQQQQQQQPETVMNKDEKEKEKKNRKKASGGGSKSGGKENHERGKDMSSSSRSNNSNNSNNSKEIMMEPLEEKEEDEEVKQEEEHGGRDLLEIGKEESDSS
ncbi:Cell cycle serine/threonine-protein kinase cdc5/MSD2 [Modicella reniformis]|uniref:Cell cycle serine/threonine-protein kinase cdc5/MSD2 n=1 Tax=Modicella reniformis TaxID=1440133 RepID=A0A9P6IJH5_9FUNG|nr:Cell cycle serine/threonine-protein kinase cdc5/MSD2 [Modicella reniformis]